MRQLKILALIIFVSFTAAAQNSVQQKQLGLVAQNFMKLYNTGDSAAYGAFLHAVMPDKTEADRLLDRYNFTYNFIGKVDIRKMVPVTPEKMEIWTQDQRYEAWWKFTVITDSQQRFKQRYVEPTGFTEAFLKKGKLTSRQIVSEVDQYIEKRMSKEFAGNIFIAHNTDVIYSRSFGLDQEGKPNTLEHTFGLASMGKMFTAVSMLQLKDKGLLSLEDTVGKFLPELKNKAVAGITISQLLTHTSGMGDFFETPLFEKLKDSLKTSADFLPFIEEDKLAFEPGKDWRYSNTGFALLGIIIERISKQSFEEYVKEHIFEPAGMDHSTPGQGAGGGRSTVSDLYHFSTALLDNKLLTKATTTSFLTYTVNGKYGYGTEHLKLGDEHVVGHSGGFIKECTELNIYPKNRYIVVILSNTDPPFGHFVSNKIKELLVRK
jgi:CubicO group peptidase (beta-lactamase class C family)